MVMDQRRPKTWRQNIPQKLVFFCVAGVAAHFLIHQTKFWGPPYTLRLRKRSMTTTPIGADPKFSSNYNRCEARRPGSFGETERIDEVMFKRKKLNSCRHEHGNPSHFFSLAWFALAAEIRPGSCAGSSICKEVDRAPSRPTRFLESVHAVAKQCAWLGQ